MGGGELYNEQREYFLSFLARTNQKQRTVENLADYLPVYSPQTVEAVKKGKRVKFLDLGPGIGGVFVPFTGSLGDKIDCVIQEPNLGMAVNFFFNYLMEDLPHQRLRIENKEVFDYDSEGFDFILSSHSFYYLPEWENTVQKVYDSLVPGGAACIVLGSRESNLIELRAKFFPELYSAAPKTAEDLEAVLDSMKIPYKSSLVHSRIDVSDGVDFEKSLKRVGTWEPSLDSLLSFMLRTDFTKLNPEMQKRVRAAVYSRADRRYLSLTDKAIWIEKPGRYEREDAAEIGREKFTLGDFVEKFRPMIENQFGEDVAFLSPGLREAYYSILALDCVLTHPLSRLSIMSRNSALVTQDDDARPTPILGQRINDFWIVDPENKGFKDCPGLQGEMYTLMFTLSHDTQTFLIEALYQEYDFLSEEDKRDVTSKTDFFGLILNIFDRFKHNQVFSNRHNGATLLGLYLMSEFLDREKLKTPKKVTPKLAEYYRELGINI
ncbi:class I SAM-dependent methyltransferase [Candidatus Woesearchaeota archaeon]|nr:class I SAM-dependent methyltransferase [Candidatus Woesearchaeota archaeon]